MEFLRFDGVDDRVLIPNLVDGNGDWTLEFKITILVNADIHVLGPANYLNSIFRWFRVNVPAQTINICGTANFGIQLPCPLAVNETAVFRLVSTSTPSTLTLFKNGTQVSQLTYTTGMGGFDRIGANAGAGAHGQFDLYYLNLQNGSDSRQYSSEGIVSGTTLPDLINSANNGTLTNFTGNHWLDDSLFTAPSTITPGVEFTSTVLAPFVNGPAMLAFHGVNVPVTITGGSFTTTMPLFVDDAIYPRVPLNGSLILTQGANTANIFRAIGMPANTETLRTPQGTISNFYDIIADNDEFLGYQFAQANNPLTTADTLYWDNSNGLVFEPESVYDVPEGAAPFTTTLWVRRGSNGKMFSHDFSLSSAAVSVPSNSFSINTALPFVSSRQKYDSYTEEFLLPVAYRTPAKMPMHPLFPRPVEECTADARQLWAHPQMSYEIPIAVQGGSWPFKYEIINGPAGATIGNYVYLPNYGNITWLPTANAGTVNWHVRVTDQEQNVVNFHWTTTIDPSKFIFVDVNAEVTGSGTLQSPLKNWSDWYFGSATDNTYQGKILVFRGGRHFMSGVASNNNVDMSSQHKPSTLIGMPGEWPVIDGSSSKFYVTSVSDFFVSHLQFENGRQDVGNAHYFWMVGACSRTTYFNNRWRSLGPGTNGNDNTCTVFISGTATVKQNILFRNNHYDGINTSRLNEAGNSALMDLYNCSYVLVEDNHAENSYNAHGYWMKCTDSYVTIRNNVYLGNPENMKCVFGYGVAVLATPHHHEMCWNRFEGGIGCVTSNHYTDSHHDTYVYRNFSLGNISHVRFGRPGIYEMDANLIISLNMDSVSFAEMTQGQPSIISGDASLHNGNYGPKDSTKKFFLGCDVY